MVTCSSQSKKPSNVLFSLVSTVDVVKAAVLAVCLPLLGEQGAGSRNHEDEAGERQKGK